MHNSKYQCHIIVTGLGRRTRQKIAKWNQMTALRFQTQERHQTSPASLRGVNRGTMKVYQLNIKYSGHVNSCVH